MKYLLPLILLTGCAASLPMPDKECNEKADVIAAATTPATDYQIYGMDRLGRKEDAYIECMKSK